MCTWEEVAYFCTGEPLSHQSDILIHNIQLFESMAGVQLCNLCHQFCEGLFTLHEWSHKAKCSFDLVEELVIIFSLMLKQCWDQLVLLLEEGRTLHPHKLFLLYELVKYCTVGHHREDLETAVVSHPLQTQRHLHEVYLEANSDYNYKQECMGHVYLCTMAEKWQMANLITTKI